MLYSHHNSSSTLLSSLISCDDVVQNILPSLIKQGDLSQARSLALQSLHQNHQNQQPKGNQHSSSNGHGINFPIPSSSSTLSSSSSLSDVVNLVCNETYLSEVYQQLTKEQFYYDYRSYNNDVVDDTSSSSSASSTSSFSSSFSPSRNNHKIKINWEYLQLVDDTTSAKEKVEQPRHAVAFDCSLRSYQESFLLFDTPKLVIGQDNDDFAILPQQKQDLYHTLSYLEIQHNQKIRINSIFNEWDSFCSKLPVLQEVQTLS